MREVKGCKAEARTSSGAGAVFLCLLSVYLLTMRGSLGGGPDEEYAYEMAENLVTRATVSVQPRPEWPEGGLRARNGRYYAAFGVGQSVTAAPLYALGLLVAGPSPAARPLRVWLVTLLNPLVSAVTGALLFLLVWQLGYGRRIALVTTLLFGLGTLLWPYSKTFLSEPLTAFCLLLSVYALARGSGAISGESVVQIRGDGKGRKGTEGDGREPIADCRLPIADCPGSGIRQIANRKSQIANAVAAGAAVGWATVVRPFMGITIPLLVAYIQWGTARRPFLTGFGVPKSLLRRGGRDRRTPETRWRWGLVPNGTGKGGALCRHLAFLIPVVVSLVFVFGYNVYRYGTWTEFGYGPEVSGAFTPAIWCGLIGNLFSPARSLFLYAPVVLLSFWGWGPFLRRHRALGWLCVGLVVEALLFYSARRVWWGNWCWGPRYFVPVLAFLMLPVAAALAAHPTRRFRLTAAAVGTVGVISQLLGVLVYNGRYLDYLENVKGWPLQDTLYSLTYSPFVGHFRYLLAGQLDGWLWTAATVDPALAVAYAALPLAGFLLSARALIRLWRVEGEGSPARA